MSKDFATITRRLDRVDAYFETFRLALGALALQVDVAPLLKAFDEGIEVGMSRILGEARSDNFLETFEREAIMTRRWLDMGRSEQQDPPSGSGPSH